MAAAVVVAVAVGDRFRFNSGLPLNFMTGGRGPHALGLRFPLFPANKTGSPQPVLCPVSRFAPRSPFALRPALKITINDSVPSQIRPQVEALVRTYARDAQVLWLPSRFPRLVMLVEPGGAPAPEENAGSIFESPTSGTLAVASVTAYLEQKIQALLEGENGSKLSGSARSK